MAKANSFLFELTQIHRALQDSLSDDGKMFVRKGDASAPELQAALASLPTSFPEWVAGLDHYDEKRFGPLLGVSDEGSAAEVIVRAALDSAKAKALDPFDSAAVGVMVDGERMTSAGEVPIGPDEYKVVVGAAFGRTHCTTNVGVRVNARLYQPLPEFQVPAAEEEVAGVADKIVAHFKPFVDTPNGRPRPLTVRLALRAETSFEVLKALVRAIEVERQAGKLAANNIHRLSLLIVFEREIRAQEDSPRIEQVLDFAALLGVPEVALDGKLLEGARKRLSVQDLLNVLDVKTLRKLLQKAAALGVRLTHRYELDPESAARTIWTGLHAARTYGMNAAKYGLIPLTLEQQETVVRLISRWTAPWTAVPAFYVDTPLLIANDVFDETRCDEALELWMDRMSSLGVKLILVDCPDRITPRRLMRESESADDRGVLTLAQIESLANHARRLGLKVLWSGGITPPQAFALARLGVSGIFSTSATAERIAVGQVLASDPQLAVENEPTEAGVRRVHALIQGGFLVGVLRGDGPLCAEIERQCQELLSALAANRDAQSAVGALDPLLARGWQRHWKQTV